MVKIKTQNVRALPRGELRTAYSSTPELNPFIFSKVLIQIARVHMVLEGATYCRKGATTSETTDDRQQ